MGKGICHYIRVLLTLSLLSIGSVAGASTAPLTSSNEPIQEETAVFTDPAVNMKNVDAYYITKGKKYDAATSLVDSISRDKTGLPLDGNSYYYRMEKNVVGDYFYSLKAYDAISHVRLGNFLVAKDGSCVYIQREGKESSLIFGSPTSLLEKTDVVVYPGKIAMGSYGIVRIHTPGRVPYDSKVTSLRPDVAVVADDGTIVPKKEGKVDIVVDIKMGKASKTVTKTIEIVGTSDNRHHDDSRRPTIGIGVGIGWGGGWHHHDGGIGVWI